MFVQAQRQTCQVQIRLYSVERISRFVYHYQVNKKFSSTYIIDSYQISGCIT